MYKNGSHTILYLTNESPAKCEILHDSILQYLNDQRCDEISVNHVNLVQNSFSKHYCISITKAPPNVEIGVVVKLNAPMINIVINL